MFKQQINLNINIIFNIFNFTYFLSTHMVATVCKQEQEQQQQYQNGFGLKVDRCCKIHVLTPHEKAFVLVCLETPLRVVSLREQIFSIDWYWQMLNCRRVVILFFINLLQNLAGT